MSLTVADKTEYSFALLAEQYSTDTASTSAGSNGAFGGIYEGVSLGQMVPTFENWSVDSQRKYGDTEIVESDFGYHIMFFINSCSAYEAQIISELKNEKINSISENADIKHHDRIIDYAVIVFTHQEMQQQSLLKTRQHSNFFDTLI